MNISRDSQNEIYKELVLFFFTPSGMASWDLPFYHDSENPNGWTTSTGPSHLWLESWGPCVDTAA